MDTYDCMVVGASFSGLACATALARRGMRTLVVEKKPDVGHGIRTTGILVKDLLDQVPLLDGLPTDLTRRIPGVRLYAPSLRYVDLQAPGYYFLATDTPAVVRWLAGQAKEAGATIACGAAFPGAERMRSGFHLPTIGTTRYLVGADGPRSCVAQSLGLGTSRHYLQGVEHEYGPLSWDASDRLHCFIDRRIAPGYVSWVVAGVGVTQVGIARRQYRHSLPIAHAMQQFLAKIAPIVDLRSVPPSSIRSGVIPCGGLVRPVACGRALLVGDAAGMVSPLTAGGIHTALQHGLAAGHAISDFLSGKAEDPCGWFVKAYPSFRWKRWLRFLFDHFQSDTAFNAMIATPWMRRAASIVYFHRKGVFDASDESSPAWLSRTIRQQHQGVG